MGEKIKSIGLLCPDLVIQARVKVTGKSIKWQKYKVPVSMACMKDLFRNVCA